MDRTVVASLLDSAEERPDSAEHHAGEIPGMKVTESATESKPPMIGFIRNR